MCDQLSISDLQALIEAARGRRRCDTVIRGGFVLNVFTGELTREDVGIMSGRIAVISANEIEAEHVIDASGLFIVPGFIDSHMHLESSILTPAEFARSVLPLGTTAVVVDPHEIANVAGVEGIRELMEASQDLPLSMYFMINPNVPASGLDASGAAITAEDLSAFADDPRVLGIAEVMDFPSVIEAREEILDKLRRMSDKVIDGHCPGLSGRDLQAYAAAGISSDHETTNTWEGLEKLRAGMYLMIREGSAAHDLDNLAALVNPYTVDRCLLVTDDLQPTDIEERGHINYLLRKMVKRGVTPAQAVKMATLNAAQRFRLDHIGAVAPGYAADIAILEDLGELHAVMTIAKGRLVAMDGEMVVPLPPHRFSSRLTHTMHLPDLSTEDLVIPARSGQARVIEAIENQLITRQVLLTPASLSGKVISDTACDVLKIVVVERHGKSGSIGLGLVKGFGLKSGAIAGSVAHDSHNVVAVGVSDVDILRAIQHIGEMNGGLVVVSDGEVRAQLPLPIGGLISTASAHAVAGRLREIEQAAKGLGCRMEHPFGTLSFMCLSVIPELKITAAGLVDVSRFEIVPLFTEERGKLKHAAAG